MSPIFSRGLTGAPIRRELGFAAPLKAIPLSATWGEIMSRKVPMAGRRLGWRADAVESRRPSDAAPPQREGPARCRTVRISFQACPRSGCARRATALTHILFASSVRQIRWSGALHLIKWRAFTAKCVLTIPMRLSMTLFLCRPKPNDRIFEVGCGSGQATKSFANEAFRSSRLTLDRKCFVAREKA